MVRKDGETGVTPAALLDMLQVARTTALSLIEQLDTMLTLEESVPAEEKLGFFQTVS